jgi:hypothetical protein
VYQWCGLKSRQGKNKNLTAQKYNSNTVWFKCPNVYIIFSIYLVSQVTLISSGTDIVWGCHLLRCSDNILYFLWLYNELFIFLYNILKNCCARLLSNYNIKYICTIYTRLDTCLMSISWFSLRDKVTLRVFYGADVVEWSRALDIRLGYWSCSISMVWVQIPSRDEQKCDSSQKFNANTVWFNFETYIYYLVFTWYHK